MLNQYALKTAFHFQKNNTGHVFADIEGDSPASKAGVNNGDVLACVGGDDVTRMEHETTVTKIK